MPVTRKKRYIAAFLQASRTWFFIALGLAALGGLYYFLATVGPKRVAPSAAEVIAPDDPAVARLSDDISELEKQYRRAADAQLVTTEAVEALAKAVDKQRELIRNFSKAGIDQSTRLVRLETELDSVRAKEKMLLVDRLEKDGEDLMSADKADAAGEKWREALRLQREINLSSASSRYKNYVRETSLSQALATVEAEPLRKEMDAALLVARKASADERWADALNAYTSARDMQARINREYGRTRYADLAGADRLTAEIESLNAAGIASEIDAKEKEGDQAVAKGRSNEAGALFTQAGILQLQVNKNYPRSRFVSSQRIEDLELKRQTALSSEMADALTALDKEIGEHLRKRQIVSAEQKLQAAGEIV